MRTEPNRNPVGVLALAGLLFGGACGPADDGRENRAQRPQCVDLDDATRAWIASRSDRERARWDESSEPEDQLLAVLDDVLVDGVPLAKTEAALVRAATSNPEAAVVLARGLLRGGLGAPDPTRAAAWLAEAARTAHPQACVDLAQLYERGVGVPVDQEEARRLLELAAAEGHPAARRDRLLAALEGDALLEVRHLDWAEQLDERGDPLGLAALGRALLETAESARDVTDARTLLERAAQDGDPAAETLLAELDDADHDLAGARARAEIAAAGGWWPAQRLLAFLCEEENDLVAAERWFRTAANSDHPSAMLDLAAFLTGREETVPEAIALAAALSERDDPEGHALFGHLALEHGDAEQQGLGYVMLRVAAAKGHGPACHSVARYHAERGEEPAANRYLRRAAELGEVDAQLELAERARRTHPAEAARWWFAAAETGDTRAVRALGEAFRDGVGVPQDHARAEELLAFAAADDAALADDLVSTNPDRGGDR